MIRNNNEITTIETCEGTACARCKVNVEMCACRPNGMRYRAMTERISGQGWVPATEAA